MVIKEVMNKYLLDNFLFVSTEIISFSVIVILASLRISSIDWPSVSSTVINLPSISIVTGIDVAGEFTFATSSLPQEQSKITINIHKLIATTVFLKILLIFFTPEYFIIEHKVKALQSQKAFLCIQNSISFLFIFCQ